MTDEIWKGDKLDRKSDAIYIQRYLENLYSSHKRQQGFVMNINSRWGGGKTFFLDRLRKQIARSGFITVFYSAWKNDYSSEPLLSFVATVEEQLLESLPTQLKPKARGLAKLGIKAIKPIIPAVVAVIVRQLTGLSLEKLVELVRAEDDSEENTSGERDKDATKKIFGDVASKSAEAALKDYKSSQTSINDFHEKLSKLVESADKNKNLPIFVFIDELDRCRPTFSIELLECIKHLFSVKGMYFIIATDTEQLRHSINAVYGEKFESERYLKRFFDVEYRFKKPDYLWFATYLGAVHELSKGHYVPPILNSGGHDHDVNKIIAVIFEGFSLELRDQEQVYFVIHTICLSRDYTSLHLMFLTILVSLKTKDLESYEVLKNSFPQGKIPDKLRSGYNIHTVSFPTPITSSPGTGQKSLLSLFELYVALAGKSSRELKVEDYERYGSIIERDICRVVIENDGRISQASPTSSPQKIPRLGEYFDIVEQAGRLVLPSR